jgi:hypothetical protein
MTLAWHPRARLAGGQVDSVVQFVESTSPPLHVEYVDEAAIEPEELEFQLGRQEACEMAMARLSDEWLEIEPADRLPLPRASAPLLDPGARARADARAWVEASQEAALRRAGLMD